MSIIESAKAELDAINFGEEDSRVMIGILQTFFGQWDSGGAVSVAAPVLARLIAGLPLAPLTGEPDEWIDRSEYGPAPAWQNKRCSMVFKDKNGRAYHLDNSSQTIKFPLFTCLTPTEPSDESCADPLLPFRH